MLSTLKFLYLKLTLGVFLLTPYVCYTSTYNTNNDSISLQNIHQNLEIIQHNLELENDSIINLAKETLKLSKQSNNSHGIYYSNFYLGKIWQLRNYNDSAIFYYEKSLKIPALNEDLKAMSYMELSNIMRITGNYSPALEYALKVKDIVENNEITLSNYKTYNLLALSYQKLMEYKLAQKNFELAAKLALEQNNEGYAGVVYANIGKLLYDQNKLDEALQYFEKGTQLEYKHNLKSNLANSYVTIAQILMHKGMLDSARYYLFQATDLNRETNNKIGLTNTLMSVSNYYFATKNYNNALSHLDATIQNATKYQLKGILSDAYKLKAKINAEQKNFEEAYENFRLFYTTYNQIYNFKELNKVKSLEHQLIEKERENELYELKLDKQETINRLIIIIGSLVFMVGLFILVYLFQIKKLNRELLLSKTKAEESDKLKSKFLKTISHEIRTPLNGIVGFSEMIRSKELDENELGQINTMINKNTHDLISTIENLVDIAHLTTKQYHVTKSNFKVKKLLENVIDVAKEHPVYTSKKSIKITSETGEDVQIHTDKNIISKILLHLVKNSILYTEKGLIKLGYKVDKSKIILYVKDTGIGIPQEKIDAIFNPFTQGDEDINIKVGGTGLGLTIVNGLINIIDGEIWVGSEVNKGSTFYISLPLN